MWDRVSVAWRWIRKTLGQGLSLVTQGGREITHDQADETLRRLRWVLTRSLIPLGVVAGLWLLNWPSARARATRIAYERQAVLTQLSAAAYREAVTQIQHVMSKIEVDPELTEADRMDRLGDLSRFALLFYNRSLSTEQTSARSFSAAGSVPSRLYGWSVISDPVTGLRFRVDADADEVAGAVFRHKTQGGELNAVVQLARVACSVGAPPLPNTAEWMMQPSEAMLRAAGAGPASVGGGATAAVALSVPASDGTVK